MKKTNVMRVVCASVFFVVFTTVVSNLQAQALTVCGHAITYDGDKIPYCRKAGRELGSVHKGITRAVIVLHGLNGNAHDYFTAVQGEAEAVNVDGHTTVIAPQFLNKAQRNTAGLAEEYVYWDNADWKIGNRSEDGSRNSSFEWIDTIVTRLIDNNPDLEHIAIVGFSAGGQAVHRYAGTAKVYWWAILSKDVTISYGVFSPSSYMWLVPYRPATTNNCPNFNKYKYGLDNIQSNRYMKDMQTKTIEGNYVWRRIYYAVGQNDTSTDYPFDNSCEAKAQGATRLERAKNYDLWAGLACIQAGLDNGISWEESGNLCGSWYTDRTPLQIVPNVAHDHEKMFQSTQGRNILFFWE